MSIVRVGLAETDGYADGYEAIFGKKKQETPAEAPKVKKAPKPAAAKKAGSAKKKGKK